MDPIRTAVKYSLIPLRTLVELGEVFVESGEQAPLPPQPARPAPKPRRQTAARKPETDSANQGHGAWSEGRPAAPLGANGGAS